MLTHIRYRPDLKTLLVIADILAACSQSKYADGKLLIFPFCLCALSSHLFVVTIYQCFQVLASSDTQLLSEAQNAVGTPFIHSIRQLLISEDVNDVYLFVACLDSLNPKLWAGTTPGTPSALEAWEVERIMQLLDSQDSTLRRKVGNRNVIRLTEILTPMPDIERPMQSRL